MMAHMYKDTLQSVCVIKEALNIVSSQFLTDFAKWHHNAVDKYTIPALCISWGLSLFQLDRYYEVSLDDCFAMYCL